MGLISRVSSRTYRFYQKIMFGSNLLAARLAHTATKRIATQNVARRSLNSWHTGGMNGKFVPNHVPLFLRQNPLLKNPLWAISPKRLMSWPYRFVLVSLFCGMTLTAIGMSQGEEALNEAFGVSFNWTLVAMIIFFKPIQFVGYQMLWAW